jgi:hypothetical protein
LRAPKVKPSSSVSLEDCVTLRTLCHEREYDEAVDDLVAENRRYADAVAGVEFNIARDARKFPMVTERSNGIADMRVGPSEPIGGLAPFAIYFTIDSADSGTLWWIERFSLRDLFLSLN